jgi:hypothetical protein
MKNTFLMFIGFLLINFNTFAQNKDKISEFSQKAQNYWIAYQKADTESLVSNSYKDYYKATGTNAKDFLSFQMKQFDEVGQVYENIIIEKPTQILKTNENWQAIFPTSLVVQQKARGKRFKVNTSTWGISLDKGKTWEFLDFMHVDQKKGVYMIPKFNQNLTIPSLEEKIMN